MRKKFILTTHIKYEFKDDPITFEQLMKIIIAAQEISNLTAEESEKYQKNMFRY